MNYNLRNNLFTNGIDFYFHLRNSIPQDEALSENGRYKFVKWMKNGGLQFYISENQKKTIPPEILIVAYYAKGRKVGNLPPIRIDYDWVRQNGQDNYCFSEVINYLIEKYCIAIK
jgi:hypothetical protein